MCGDWLRFPPQSASLAPGHSCNFCFCAPTAIRLSTRNDQRAKSLYACANLLALGDIAAARLLLERVANAQDATAALLLAQTYDPTVLDVRDTRSVTPDPVLARDRYRKAASLGSVAAQQRHVGRI